ncbi:hypothetical protein ACHAW5_001811 [Stephanodiscus triporus]|uniref:Uncharacterized protein n=1 Tax=Stephanodiscus triporus TaxID=2934178 RepID=A0ABD3NJ64_9STRA
MTPPTRRVSSQTTVDLPARSSYDNDAADASSVGSASSSKSEERRRKRESWRRQHDDQLRVDGTFPRRRGGGQAAAGEDRREAAFAVVQHLGTKSTAKPHTLPPAVSDDVRVRSNLLRTLGISNSAGSKGGSNQGGGGNLAGGGGVQCGGTAGGGEASLLSGGGGVEPLHGKNVTAASGRSLLSSVRFKEELKYDSDEDVDPYVPQPYNRFFGGLQRQRSRSIENKSPNNMMTGGVGGRNHGRTTSANPARRRRLGFVDEVQVVPIPMRSEYSSRIKERMYSGRVELSENAQRNVVEFEAEGWDATTVLDDENQFYKCPLTGELIHPVHLAYFNKGVGGEANSDHR